MAVLTRLPTCSFALDRVFDRRRRAFIGERGAGTGPEAGTVQTGASGWPALADLDPASIRTADTAVIVASGPSARRAADPAIGDRPDLDFFALNHAAALPVPARLYTVEEPVLKGRQAGTPRADAVGLLDWALRRRDARSRNAPIVVRGSTADAATRTLLADLDQHRDGLVVAPRFALPVNGSRGPNRYADWARRRQPFAWPVGGEPVLSPRGGLGFLFSLCVALGYPTIVLVGVDMTSDEYFFDDWDHDAELLVRRDCLAPPSRTPHLTSVRTGSRAPVGDLLVALDRRFLRPQGRTLAIASTSSRLYPDLRLYDWERARLVGCPRVAP